jgi:hypothetical protein
VDEFGVSVTDTVHIIVLNETDPTGVSETKAIEGSMSNVRINHLREGHLLIQLEDHTRIHVTLWNTIGQLVMERTVKVQGRYHFLLPSIASGLYFIRVDDGQSVESRKLMYWK